ncbi:DUF523 domain-containing protein [Desulfopila sp. IMCC35008]|uniref:DUF523 domain-containing protein n=1 Tax=Desulfopila sp. IMCC35008 TaxID=2653858 RepID=UPI0013D411B8|nr:DUF523 domain-containing protein [Desulfopila sp. IMCC35008]
MRIKILVSSCLLGNPVRYNGTAGKLDKNLQSYLEEECDLYALCPECEGGLDTPRQPAEICEGTGDDVLGGTACVKTCLDRNVTDSFILGAQRCVEFCKREEISICILKERSPSCGSSTIYDGTFTGRLIQGRGVTTAMLVKNNITVFSDENINELIQHLKQNETV